MEKKQACSMEKTYENEVTSVYPQETANNAPL